MPSRGRAHKRLALFTRGEEAWRAVGGTAGRYACPLCVNEFVEADAATGQLTLEHVPPGAVGGKPLCLTCKPCNDRGGSLVDSALAELATMRRMQEALFLKRGSFTGPVTATVGGVEANAVMSVDKGQLTIEVDERRNAPGRLDAQIDHFKNYRPEVDDAPPSLNLSGRNRAGDRLVITSILRASYLVAFSTFGYRFATDPKLEVVRNQIADPTTDQVPQSCAIFVDRDEEPGRVAAVGILRGPVRGVAVYLPADTVVYPQPVLVTLPGPDSPRDFYEQLDRLAGDEGRINVDATFGQWPREPAYLWDHDEI